MVHDILNPDLHALRDAFLAGGRDLRLVGGCVRDILMGQQPKDIDLCTDATPTEMAAIAAKAGFSIHPTGIDHGTMTFVLNHVPYEVTTLRTESDHDGRWATVAFTNDWIADLARRDLTINAMMATFEGEIIDPFGGRADLTSRRVRFVGDAGQRIREDYLRILRWLRFHGRIARDQKLDKETCEAVQANAAGLARISRERVWAEVQKIVEADTGPAMLAAMHDLGIAPHIDLPRGDFVSFVRVHHVTRFPHTLMAAYLGHDVEKLAKDWKWSRLETDGAKFLLRHPDVWRIDQYKALMAVHGIDGGLVRELAKFHGDRDVVVPLLAWKTPSFPVTGSDLLALGFTAGPALGKALAYLKEVWCESDYRADRQALLQALMKLG